MFRNRRAGYALPNAVFKAVPIDLSHLLDAPTIVKNHTSCIIAEVIHYIQVTSVSWILNLLEKAQPISLLTAHRRTMDYSPFSSSPCYILFFFSLQLFFLSVNSGMGAKDYRRLHQYARNLFAWFWLEEKRRDTSCKVLTFCFAAYSAINRYNQKAI